ncbi:MAG: hypothetical protein CMM53_08380 [Rhodospirillaceae bacterium]|nr:hypothetical protein [Rhodospirillaceae bacterium]
MQNYYRLYVNTEFPFKIINNLQIWFNLVVKLSLLDLKKIFTAITAVALIIVFSRCSGTRAQTVDNDCVVTNWQIAGKVNERVPEDMRTEFREIDKRVYAFISLNCTKPANRIGFKFIRNGQPYAFIQLPNQKSSNWRTWATVKAVKGSWLVRVFADKRLLLSDKFLVR